MCPCNNLRVGSFLLALAVCVAMSARVLFGTDASALLRAALAGNVVPVAWGWSVVVLIGLWRSATGLHAALSHTDPIRFGSLVWSATVIWLVTYYLPHVYKPADFTPALWAWLNAFTTAWAVENAANVWLQLRGLFPRRRQPLVPLPPSSTFPIFGWVRRRWIHVEEEYYPAAEPPARSRQEPPPLRWQAVQIISTGTPRIRILPPPSSRKNLDLFLPDKKGPA